MEAIAITGLLFLNALIVHRWLDEAVKRRQAEADCKTLRLLCDLARDDKEAA